VPAPLLVAFGYEHPVRVQAGPHRAGQHRQLIRVHGAGVLNQRRLYGLGVTQGRLGQVGDRSANQGRVPIGNRSFSHRRRNFWEPRRQTFSGQSAARSQLRGQPYPPGGLPPADPQPLGQHHRRRRAPQLGRDAARVQLGHHGVLDRCPLPRVGF